MSRLILLIILVVPAFLSGQAQSSISVIDFVEIKNDKRIETLFYYENNWKVYRDIALQKKFIKSYKLLTTPADSAANFDLILITEYVDSVQFKSREKNFQEIIKKIRPNGPKLLNDYKPNDFRKNLYTKQAETLFLGDQVLSQGTKKVDNYTVQYLIIYNNKGDVLLQKNHAGWHTLAIRSNENQSINEAMDSLAGSIGLKINSLRLAGLYTYKFAGLPDHREASFRTHFTARSDNGKLIQPNDTTREYRWVPIKEAIDKLTFESLRLETSQILKNPKKVWGGTFLIMWEQDKFLGSKVLELPYPLNE